MVLVAAGQLRRRPGLDGSFAPEEPARLAAACLRHAAASAGRPALVGEADALAWVPCISWALDKPGRALAEALGRGLPSTVVMPEPGGDGPTTVLNRLANRIAAGEVRIALLAGAKVLHSVRGPAREGLSLESWMPRTKDLRKLMGDQKPFASPLEVRHHVRAPVHMYPLLENSLRARSGRWIQERRAYLGRPMQRYSDVARDNPCSWSPKERSAEDLVRVDEGNRWICFPYPKLVNAIIEVGQRHRLPGEVDHPMRESGLANRKDRLRRKLTGEVHTLDGSTEAVRVGQYAHQRRSRPRSDSSVRQLLRSSKNLTGLPP